MKKLISLFVILSTLTSFGQKGIYYDFSSAFKNTDSVIVISINCMHCNEIKTDGCDSIPINIDKFKNLSNLELSETYIKSLPKNINTFKRLKYLNLKSNYYLDYEKELCKIVGLDSLEFLGLWMANIINLPYCITQLKTLKNIDLSFNDDLNIENTFTILIQLPNIETIDLSGINNLKVIPKEIKKLKKLKTIKLNHFNGTFDFAESFRRLSLINIKAICLSDNRLKTIPDEIQLFQSLEYIDLSDNIFDSLPSPLFELSNLKEIKIQNNNHSFRHISSQIANLRKLEKINLGNNDRLDGKSVIISLSNLSNLKELDFFDCQLKKIPNEIRNFKVLESLNLERNSDIEFADLFDKLSAIKTLKNLNIGDNELTELPKEIGLLTNLEYLNIGENPIETIPEEFYQLKNLKILNVYGYVDSEIKETVIKKIKEKLPDCKIIKECIFRD